MQGAAIRKNFYHRCTTRTMAPGLAAAANHPPTMNLREDVMIAALNGCPGEP
jgi:hypothetical protein